MNCLVPGVEVILGLDLIGRMGGVEVGPGYVKFVTPKLTENIVATCQWQRVSLWR